MILHVNPQLDEKGLAVIYNPLNKVMRENITLPLYYTGLTTVARIREQDGKLQRYAWTAHIGSKCRLRCRPAVSAWLVVE